MPKEISHIALAEHIAARLPDASLFQRPVSSHPHVFLYGAVTPDIPYFYLLGPRAARIHTMARQFHTSDNNSILPILSFIRLFPDQDPDALAFAAGLCCHIICDTVFHPMVYYYAGLDDVHEGATARHRMFETAMDIHFWHQLTDSHRRSLYFLFRHLEISRHRFGHLCHTLFKIPHSPEARYLNQAVRSHQIIQTLFFRPWLFKAFKTLCAHKIIKRRRFHALVYPWRQPVKLRFFNRPITFKDPCLGDTQTSTIDALTRTAAERTITLLNIIGDTLKNNRDLATVASHPDLPEIRPCLAHYKDSLTHWHRENDIETMLYTPCKE